MREIYFEKYGRNYESDIRNVYTDIDAEPFIPVFDESENGKYLTSPKQLKINIILLLAELNRM